MLKTKVFTVSQTARSKYRLVEASVLLALPWVGTRYKWYKGGHEERKIRYRKRRGEQGFSSRHVTSKYILYTVNSII